MMELLVLLVAVLLGSIVSAFCGFAFSAAAGAVLFHFYDPIRTVPFMMVCSIASQALTMFRLRRSVEFSAAAPLVLPGLVGAAAAAVIFASVDSQLLRAFFGLFLATYALYLLYRGTSRSYELSGPRWTTAVGVLGGVFGVFMAMPGAIPSIWCELRGCTKEQQRGLVQPFILGMQITSLLFLSMTPIGLPGELALQFLMVVPVIAVGNIVGLKLFHVANDVFFRRSVLVMLLGSGLLLLR